MLEMFAVLPTSVSPLIVAFDEILPEVLTVVKFAVLPVIVSVTVRLLLATLPVVVILPPLVRVKLPTIDVPLALTTRAFATPEELKTILPLASMMTLLVEFAPMMPVVLPP